MFRFANLSLSFNLKGLPKHTTVDLEPLTAGLTNRENRSSHALATWSVRHSPGWRTNKRTQTQRYTPPSPPVAFTVPWDVFYPFFMSTSGGTASAAAPSRYAAAVSVAATLGPAVFTLFIPKRVVF